MRKLWMLIALVGLAVGAMLLLARSQRSEWTSSTPEALAELEKGHQAQMKIYDAEARKHYRRALELDPDFVAAKLALMSVTRDRERLAELAADLETANLEQLTAREQFLVRYRLARSEGDAKEAKQIIRAFVDSYPQDPWGLDVYADYLWRDKNLEKASRVYQKLLAADPNWVLAQNRLGYAAMALGDFEEAEEIFKTYAYIAPDQANPHDSMGELLTVLGRYDEARAELEKALAIKPDFCGSYRHLEEVEILEGNPDAVEPILERAEKAGCGGGWMQYARCEVDLWKAYLSRDYDAPWREENRDCAEKLGGHFLIHRMASLTGRFEQALAIEEELAKGMSWEGQEDTAEIKYYKGFLLHLAGVRKMAQGDLAEAQDSMQKADELFYYWGQDESILKLFNRLNLATAYELAGERRQAKKLLAEVAAVNPPFAGFYGYLLESFSS